VLGRFDQFWSPLSHCTPQKINFLLPLLLLFIGMKHRTLFYTKAKGDV